MLTERQLLTRLRRLGHRTAAWEPFELGEYIHSAKTAADRVRYIIYIGLIVSVFIFMAVWNVDEMSWSIARMRAHLEKTQVSAFGQAVLKEYPREFVERMVLVNVPLLGIAIDINDFGFLGGLTLMAMTALLYLSLRAMHENLCLAFYKVQQLVLRDRKASRGESKANFLYHALAMGQVLHRPPTLTRWKANRRSFDLAWFTLRAALLVPVLVHGYVVWGNLGTKKLAGIYGIPHAEARLNVQMALLVAIFILATLCFLHARAIDQRWRDMFFMINPELRLRQQQKWWRWLRIRSRWTREEKRLRDRLLARLTRRSELPELPPGHRTVTVETTVPYRGAKRAALSLMYAAHHRARAFCRQNRISYAALTGFRLHYLQQRKRRLVVRSTWSFQTHHG
jgi:hypothetical protein